MIRTRLLIIKFGADYLFSVLALQRDIKEYTEIGVPSSSQYILHALSENPVLSLIITCTIEVTLNLFEKKSNIYFDFGR